MYDRVQLHCSPARLARVDEDKQIIGTIQAFFRTLDREEAGVLGERRSGQVPGDRSPQATPARGPRGGGRNRTAVRGFAGPCLNHSATPPWRPASLVLPVGMVESVYADRHDRATMDSDPSAAIRRDRAGRRPAGPWSPGCRSRRARCSPPATPPVRSRVGGSCPAPRATRIGMAVPEIRHVIHAYEAVRRLRRRPRPHGHGPIPCRALPRPAGDHHHPRPVQR